MEAKYGFLDIPPLCQIGAAYVSFQPTPRQFTGIKAFVFALCMIPLGHLVQGIVTDGLGANPIEAVTRGLGDWALRLLLLTLAVTPLRRLTGINWLLRLRRMLGLFTFFYATLHMLTYVWLDQFFAWDFILRDIVKRPFITVGFISFVLLIPLAVTSTNAMMKRLGRYWSRLHKAVYAIAILAVLHFWWMVKADVREPALYAGMLAVLLGSRLVWWVRARQSVRPRPERPKAYAAVRRA